MERAAYLTPEQCQEIERRLPPDIALICRIMRQTGLRVSDVLHLRTRECAESAEMVIKERKTDKYRCIWLGDVWPDVWERAWQQGARRKRWLFDGRSANGTMGRYKVHRWIRAIAWEIGYESVISPHSWRKCYAVAYAEKNGLSELQRDLNHSNPATTALYAYADKICPAKIKNYRLTKRQKRRRR